MKKTIKRIIKTHHIEKITDDLYFIMIGCYTSSVESKKDIFKKIIELIKLNYKLVKEC